MSEKCSIHSIEGRKTTSYITYTLGYYILRKINWSSFPYMGKNAWIIATCSGWPKVWHQCSESYLIHTSSACLTLKQWVGTPQQFSYSNSGNTQTQRKTVFYPFGFNTKIQRYHTSSSQISSFTLEPKLEEKGEEKRLLGGKKRGNRKSKTNSRCPDAFTSVTSGKRAGCWTLTVRRAVFS